LEEIENNETSEYIRTEKVALRLIARAEQCSAGLARKLKKRKFDDAIINEVICKLTEINLLDDSRYARLWLQSRLRFARNPRLLLSSLYSRGIDRDDAEAALRTVLNEEDTEFTLLTRFLKKYGKKADDARSLKFLLKNEGFSIQTIQRFLDEES